MNGFEAIIAVDWSASNVPSTGENSIWLAVKKTGSLEVENLSTRAAAIEFMENTISKISGRVLVGIDISFAYPSGALKGLKLGTWEQLWDLIEGLIEDDDKNQNNRFEVAAKLNQMLGQNEGPFWGCPKAKQSEYLSMKKPKHSNFADLRTTEVNVSGAQSAWKLAYVGSVGSQTLTCVARLWPLIKRLRTGRPTCVWPFEKVLKASNEVVFSEVYHSLYDFDKTDPIKDRAQVIGCCEALASAPLDTWFLEAERHPESQDEGWTLGVVRCS